MLYLTVRVCVCVWCVCGVCVCVCSTEKVDCITVNCEPVRVAVDDLIQRLFDALLTFLRRSIQGEIRCSAHTVQRSWCLQHANECCYC